MQAVICLDKYSDWLEAYSIFAYYPQITRVKILYIENERNNLKAVKSLFKEQQSRIHFEYAGFENHRSFYDGISQVLLSIEKSDIFAAPFIRYRSIWGLVHGLKKRGIITVHLSETLPDSFNRIGYRFGFRLVGGFNLKGFLKQVCSIPYMYFYSIYNKPDICFYNMYPNVKNPFVKETIRASVPAVNLEKKSFLQEKTGDEKRPLLISGFGYDLKKMVKYLSLTKYIATSKNKEIIIDGITYPLDGYICAEEVLLSGCVDSIIGYSSTAMCWAYLLGNIRITCYESKELSRLYGFMNGYLTRKTLKKCGIELLPECKEMVK